MSYRVSKGKAMLKIAYLAVVRSREIYSPNGLNDAYLIVVTFISRPPSHLG